MVVEVAHGYLEDALSLMISDPKAESSSQVQVHGEDCCQNESESSHC